MSKNNRKLLSTWVTTDMADLVDRRVKADKFVSVSDYLRSLIRRDLEAAA